MKPIVLLITFTLAAIWGAQQSDPHHDSVNQHGDHVMGFSHEKTTHHFRLYADGGAIEVTANDPKDTESRDAIRMHLTHIAGMFAEGNFEDDCRFEQAWDGRPKSGERPAQWVRSHGKLVDPGLWRLDEPADAGQALAGPGFAGRAGAGGMQLYDLSGE